MVVGIAGRPRAEHRDRDLVPLNSSAIASEKLNTNALLAALSFGGTISALMTS